MLTESEIRAVCERIKAEAKDTVRKDTRVLQRSIAFTIINGLVTFRQIYYGKYGDNSQLEKLCKRLMPYGVQWRIIYTEFGGGTREVGVTRQGRKSQSSTLSSLWKTTTSKIRNLIGAKKATDGKAKE